MPTVVIDMFEGRTPDQKKNLVSALTNAVVASLEVDASKVRVRINEIPAYHSAVGGILMAEPPKVD